MEFETGPPFRDFTQIKNNKFEDEKVSTVTSREQKKTEDSIEKCFDRFQQLQHVSTKCTKLLRDAHQCYLESLLHRLPTSYECLDCSRIWNIYWILQAAQMLNFTFAEHVLEDVITFIGKCRQRSGGFSGGPGQFAHLAPTYAAVNSLCIIGTKRAYRTINRKTLIEFLFAVRENDGSFHLHVDGETDVRGAYCAISCAVLTNTPSNILDKLFDKTGEWIASCQTYEGGFGGAPGLEAHGGYTFCGIAGLALLNETNLCNQQELLKWCLQRQMSYEGGFQGRTNKLVDGCYSFWVGGSVAITQAIVSSNNPTSLFDSTALQEYILLCCQKPNGGLIDKPGKPQDLYHTCYTLTGMAIAQHSESTLSPHILGDPSNELIPTHPLFNIPPAAVSASLNHFKIENELIKENIFEHNGDCNLSEEKYKSMETLSSDEAYPEL